MAKHRILIVDDQHEIRRMLATALRTLGPEIEVVDVPSAEEAQLEASRDPIDLLISDVRLPGITGLELVAKVHKRNPDAKIILVTGVDDPKTRRAVAEAGVAAYFYKPIEVADLLDTVERCLGLVQTHFPLPPVLAEQEEKKETPPTDSLADYLSALQRELNALTILLLDNHGDVVARAGNLDDQQVEAVLLSAVGPLLEASAKAAEALGMQIPENVLGLSGFRFHLCLMHIGPAYALVGVMPESTPLDWAAIGRVMPGAAKKLLILLAERQAAKAEAVEAEMFVSHKPEGEEPPAENLPEIDAIFSQATEKTRPANVDAFWESATGQAGENRSTGSNTLSFEEARKLGLAPGEGKK
jgi:DNA-binding NarL/FixJ family response regulator